MKDLLLIIFAIAELNCVFNKAPELTFEKVKEDFLASKDCWVNREFLNNLSASFMKTFLFGEYCIAHISINENLFNCYMYSSPIFIYHLKNNQWQLQQIIATGENLIQLDNTEYFYSQNTCTTSSSEGRCSAYLYQFSKGKLNTVMEEEGIDFYVYYTYHLIKGSMWKIGQEGYENGENNWKEFLSAINDTIVNYSEYKNFQFRQGELIECDKLQRVEILLGSIGSDSIITQKYEKKMVKRF